MYCEECGAIVSPSAKFCYNCGKTVKVRGDEVLKKEVLLKLVNRLTIIKENKRINNPINVIKIPTKSIAPNNNDALWGCLGLIVIIIIFFSACSMLSDDSDFDDSDPSYNEDSDYNSDGINDEEDTYIKERNELESDD